MIQIDTSTVQFLNGDITNTPTADFVFNSIAVNNPIAASGGGDGDTIDEIRQNSLSNFNTQQRNVTADDYLVRALSMPPKSKIVWGSWIDALVVKALATTPNLGGILKALTK